MKIVIMLLSCVLFTGCSDLGKPDVIYTVKDKESKDKEIQILVDRLDESLPSILSKIDYDKTSKEIVFINGSPLDEMIDYMSKNLGKFSIYLEGESKVLVENKDILKTNSTIRDDQAYVDIMLTESAAKILSEKTVDNIGKIIVAKLDGYIILRAPIKSELGRFFMFSADDPEDARRKSILLKHGVLSNSISLRRKSA